MTGSVAEIEAYRPVLVGHCYRMLGSVFEADDAVQETMIRAWRGLEKFDGRASLKNWLYRIATNVCLDLLAARKRRARPMEEGAAGSVTDTLAARPSEYWVEPIPDDLAVPSEGDPFERALLRQSIRLAFVAALQHLPPRQRAALLLVEVLGWSAAEAAESLDMTVAAVNSALQRARATLAGMEARGDAGELTGPQREMLERYVDAFHRYDVEALASLLREDATFSMPPYALWLRGPEAVRAWLEGPGCGCRGSRLVVTAASGWPAFGQYRVKEGGGHKAWGLIVLELEGDGIAGWNTFLEVERLFPKFGLPLELG
ncbi:MAG: sigma-70 family RNA polymerase sigma factor [Bryobacteraceae bacterium]|nr:sigma-70 family RNA polymerase sigma factor [Bryobacteraceae bacterium]